MSLTDEQCDEFRRLPLSFRDMVRAIYEAGSIEEREKIAHLLEKQGPHFNSKANKILEMAAKIREREAVMFDIQGAHATATHCAEQIRKAAKEKHDASQ